MGTCKNCKWWGWREEWEDDDEVESLQIPCEAHRVCGHPKVGGGSYADDARCEPDALNTYESVGTGPDFGCIHQEEKT